MSNELIQVKNIKTYFPIKQGLLSKVVGYVKAVDDVTFAIRKGETLGLVGESGCGKTTLGRTLLRLIPSTSGQVLYKGNDILALSEKEMRDMRREMQIIFQDPYSSLNPRLTVEKIIGEVLRVQGGLTQSEAREKVGQLLVKVGLSTVFAVRYPHEFSGGQRQRVAVARAIAMNPDFVVCDEAVSALDVSIQAQIINLLQDLKEEFGITYLFISHALNVVRHISDRVAVMYLGKIVELADTEDLFNRPLHPYTEALLSAIPLLSGNMEQNRIMLKGDVPSASEIPSGCRFRTRCRKATKLCVEQEPPLVEYGNGHYAACHYIKS